MRFLVYLGTGVQRLLLFFYLLGGISHGVLDQSGLGLALVALVLAEKFLLGGEFELGVTAEELGVLGEELVGVSVLVDFPDALGAGVLLHVVAALHEKII